MDIYRITDMGYTTNPHLLERAYDAVIAGGAELLPDQTRAYERLVMEGSFQLRFLGTAQELRAVLTQERLDCERIQVSQLERQLHSGLDVPDDEADHQRLSA